MKLTERGLDMSARNRVARRLAGLSVGTKLYASFATVLALLVLNAVVGFVASSSLASSTQQIVTIDSAKAEAANSVGGLVGYMHESQTRFILDRGVEFRDHGGDVLKFEAALAALTKLSTTATDRNYLARIESAFAFQRHFDAVLLADVKAGRTAVATSLADGAANDAADALAAAATAYKSYASSQQATAYTSFNSARSLSTLVMIMIALFALLVGVGVSVAVSRSIKRGVSTILDRIRSLQDRCATNLKAGIEALAAGNLTIDVQAVTAPIENPSNDEIGQVAQAVNGIRDRFAATIDAYNETRAKLSTMVASMSGSAAQVSSASREMASTSDETGRATSEIAHALGDVAQGAERQVRMVQTARHAAEDVTRAVNESAENAGRAAEVAYETRQVAREGIDAAAQATQAMSSVSDSSQAAGDAMRELSAKSGQIGAIVQTITGIAAQTNLLALNAAIEAARAGEQGRGFAVVAEEVRKLAEESQRAAKQITGLITAIQTDTTHAVSVVENGAQLTTDGAIIVARTHDAFTRIEAAVEDMTSRIEQIAAASQQIAASATSMQDNINEVAAVAEQSSASTEQVSASTEQTTASAQEIAASAQALSGNAEELNRLVAQFQTAA
jgi:methyl-accepting chemotaxis protein